TAGASVAPPVADCPARICACRAVVAADAAAATVTTVAVGVAIGAIGAARVSISISILDLHERTHVRLVQRKRTGQGTSQGSRGGGRRRNEGGARRDEQAGECYRSVHGDISSVGSGHSTTPRPRIGSQPQHFSEKAGTLLRPRPIARQRWQRN